MISLIIISTLFLYKCDHDSLQSRINIRKLRFPPNPGVIKESYEVTKPIRKPIRILFDLSPLTSNYDPLICRSPGQKINWGGREEICLDEDILTEEKINVLNKTLISVNNYITRAINVTQIENGFSLSNLTDIFVNKQYIEKCDTFITITTRPFGSYSSTLASAFYEVTEPEYGRPIQGAIVINAANIPLVPQNESSFDRIYFTTLLHEMIHALGVSYRAIHTWINPKTNKPYDSLPIIEYSSTKYPHKTFRILQTENAHQFAVERFGVEYFAPDVPSGIELEDGGGAGTFGSHPESRLYIDDMFVGLTIGQNHISKLIFVLLADTGWYDANFEMAEKMAWGDGNSLNMGPLTTFPNTAPQISFPKHYMCDPDDMNTDVCTYDFLGIALCKGVKVDCNIPATEDDQKFCEMRNFTDPLMRGLRGRSEVHDYLLYKAPYANSRCADLTLNNDNAYKNGELYGGESLCYMSTLLRSSFSFYPYHHGACYRSICNDNNSLTVFVDDEKKLCRSEGQKLTFRSFKGEIICPNPSFACGIRKMYGIVGPIPTSPPASSSNRIWNGFMLNKIQFIIVVAFASFVLLVILIGLFIQVRKRVLEQKIFQQKNNTQNNETENRNQNDIYEEVKTSLVL